MTLPVSSAVRLSPVQPSADAKMSRTAHPATGSNLRELRVAELRRLSQLKK